MRGESARPGKRPLRALSASEKMEAIQRVHEGESKASVARDIGVPESTLRGWCKSEHKIRGMARNSSTPDSEAHSPASSSGANNTLAGVTGASNLSSEDEAVVGPTSAKKMKLDSLGVGDNVDTGDSVKLEAKQPKMDYVSSIINSIVASGVRSENSSILLQQLGLLSSAQSAASLTKNLLGLGSTHLGSSGTGSQTVGLVENGLQYTKSSASLGLNSHQHSKRGPSSGSSSTTHGSAIAPTTQLDSVSKSGSRKSLPPAAEAPSTPVPASPRKTSEHHNGSLGLHHHQAHQQPLQHHHHHQQVHQSHQSHSRSSRKDNGLSSSSSSGSSARKADEALWLWLAQQQQLLGQQAAAAAATASPYNSTSSGVDGSWFWQWYKQCSFPMVASTALAASPANQHQQHQQQLTSSSNNSSSSNKSPSKAKALLDNVLCNNNNNSSNNKNEDSSRRSMSGNNNGILDDQDEEQTGRDLTISGTTEEAIEHGEKFFKWLDKCSEPSVTRLQILQFKYLLDNLKTCRKKTSSFKQSRK